MGSTQPALWDTAADKQMMQEDPPLQVARCTKIITAGGEEESKYVINVKQIAKVGPHAASYTPLPSPFRAYRHR